MVRADAILTAVQHIHEAAFSPNGWSCALESVAAAASSRQSIFLAQDAISGAVEFVAGFGVAPEYLAACAAAAKARALPEWMQAFAPGILQQISASHADHEFASYAFHGVTGEARRAVLGMVMPLSQARRRDVYLGVSRCLGRRGYVPGDVEVLRALAPHFATALHVADNLAVADLRAKGAGAALDRLETGVLLVDEAATIVSANQTAEMMLSGDDGLENDRGSLRAYSSPATHALRRLIARCVDITTTDGKRGGSMEIPRGEGRTPLHISVAPVQAVTEQDNPLRLGVVRPVAMVIVTDPWREQRVQKENLRLRFGFTPAEADVAIEIVKGDGRTASAGRLGISAKTVRAHLSSIFEKTGAHRQAELVRLLMQSEHEYAAPDGRLAPTS
jgi:DNA-binding CsgD family transcriptional regulator